MKILTLKADLIYRTFKAKEVIDLFKKLFKLYDEGYTHYEILEFKNGFKNDLEYRFYMEKPEDDHE